MRLPIVSVGASTSARKPASFRRRTSVEAALLERGLERAFGEVPLLVRAELLLRAGRQLEARVHSEEVVEERGVVEAAEDLVLDLVGRAEDVRVVLRDVLHAQEPVERA